MPLDVSACTFDEPLARLPGLDTSEQCPARDMVSLSWLFQIADHMPYHLPCSGGTQEQPALIMEAAELARGAMLAWFEEYPADGFGH